MLPQAVRIYRFFPPPAQARCAVLISSGDWRPLRAPALFRLALTGTPPEPLGLGQPLPLPGGVVSVCPLHLSFLEAKAEELASLVELLPQCR